jgi:hypothetical protein
MALTLDGTAGITFPVTAGSASAVQASSGRVLQVVNATYSSSLGSTNSTPTDTGLTATITPSSATSKILVMTYQPGSGKNAAADSLYAGLVRGSTTIASQNRFSLTDTNSVSQFVDLMFSVLDSPSTTSATTYKVQANRNGSAGVGYVNVDSNLCTITLMEIAA